MSFLFKPKKEFHIAKKPLQIATNLVFPEKISINKPEIPIIGNEMLAKENLVEFKNEEKQITETINIPLEKIISN